MHTGFWWGNLREWDHLEDLGINGKINNNTDLQQVGLQGAWTGQRH